MASWFLVFFKKALGLCIVKSAVFFVTEFIFEKYLYAFAYCFNDSKHFAFKLK
jgi:hypothetical protein